MECVVVMAVYNGEKYIESQIDSILKNTKLPDRFIIVDDCSKDNTIQIIENKLNEFKFENYKIIKNLNNIGASKSFFLGLDECNDTDIVFFADQDDWWFSEKIELHYNKLIEDSDLHIVFSDGLICDDELNIRKNQTIFNTRKTAILSKGRERNPKNVLANPDVKGCTMAFRFKFVKPFIKYFADTKAYQYWGHDHWIILIGYFYGKIDVINKPLILYRLHKKNTSGAVKFNPLKLNDYKKRYYLKRSESFMFYFKRYSYLSNLIHLYDKMPNVNYIRSLYFFKECSFLRYNFGSKPKHVFNVIQLYINGFYSKYYNGIYTAIADLIFY